MSNYIYSCNDPGVLVYNPCVKELGRIRAFFYIRSSYTFADPTDPAEWTSAIASGDVILVQNTRGNKDKSGRIGAPGFGNQKEITVTRDFTINYMHREVIEDTNIDFYNDMNYSDGYYCGFVTQTKLWVYEAENIVTVDADIVVEEGIDTMVLFNVAVTFIADNLALPYEIPAGIFVNLG
jgi:hypothetical protein